MRKPAYVSISLSERNITMLLRRSILPLTRQHVQTTAYQRPRLSWKDHLVNVTQTRRNILVRELLPVLLHQLRPLLFLILLGGNHH